MPKYGGIEAGGTKFVCVIGSSPDDLLAETSFPNTTPEETINRAIAFFARYQRQETLAAVGIGSFGPVDLNPSSLTYGYITTTTKPGWAHTSMEIALKVWPLDRPWLGTGNGAVSSYQLIIRLEHWRDVILRWR